MITEHTRKVSRTARYCTIGKANKHTRYFWICCHGYGQLAKNFIRKFDGIASEHTFILAPEGLSRFYWGGFSGDVVASWMTKEARLDEIEDYTGYLQDLYDHFTARMSDEVKIILFGFSQGCATQMRWICNTLPAFDSLVLWAGTVPDDIDYKPYLDYFDHKDIHFVLGKQDEFLTPQRLEAYQQLVATTGLRWQEHFFDGKHVVDREVLKNFANNTVYPFSS
jgi:predicted esterase